MNFRDGFQLTTKTQRHKDYLVSWCLGGVILALLAGCSLSAPPPPREGAPLLTPMSARPEVPFETPSRKPSVANGAAIYAEKCAACHGASGRGDGESAAAIQSQFGAAPADFTSDQVARASTPAEWFAILTAGQLERGMPPFSGSLAVDDRWDVIAYAWSLGSSEARLELGKAIYADRCVACHGATGKGDGPQAEGQLIDLSDLANYKDVAPGQWETALDTGHVPTFSGKLDSSERAAVIDYIRSFTYDAAAAAVAEATPAATPNPDAPAATSTVPATSAGITINGSITNGTSGGAQPGDLSGTLYYFPGGFDANNRPVSEPITQTFQVDANGQFAVSDLKAKAGDAVAVTVLYGDIAYWSDPILLDNTTTTLDMPVRVYEQTTASDAIHIGTLHLIAAQDGGALAVTEIYVMSNLGDRTVANTSGEPSLRFNLPAGATGFQGMSSTPGVYVPFDDGSGFGYFEAIPPGQDTVQVIVSYQLPLNGDVDLSRSPTYPINAVNVLIQAGDLTASGDQLIDQGVQEFQGQTFQVFTGGPFSANQPLTFRLARPASADPKLIAAIVLLVVGVGGIGYGLWRKQAEHKPKAQTVAVQKRKATPQAAKVTTVEREALIDQIAALDDAFAAGEIDDVSYRQKREALKAKLLRQATDR